MASYSYGTTDDLLTSEEFKIQILESLQKAEMENEREKSESHPSHSFLHFPSIYALACDLAQRLTNSSDCHHLAYHAFDLYVRFAVEWMNRHLVQLYCIEDHQKNIDEKEALKEKLGKEAPLRMVTCVMIAAKLQSQRHIPNAMLPAAQKMLGYLDCCATRLIISMSELTIMEYLDERLYKRRSMAEYVELFVGLERVHDAVQGNNQMQNIEKRLQEKVYDSGELLTNAFEVLDLTFRNYNHIFESYEFYKHNERCTEPSLVKYNRLLLAAAVATTAVLVTGGRDAYTNYLSSLKTNCSTINIEDIIFISQIIATHIPLPIDTIHFLTDLVNQLSNSASQNTSSQSSSQNTTLNSTASQHTPSTSQRSLAVTTSQNTPSHSTASHHAPSTSQRPSALATSQNTHSHSMASQHAPSHSIASQHAPSTSQHNLSTLTTSQNSPSHSTACQQTPSTCSTFQLNPIACTTSQTTLSLSSQDTAENSTSQLAPSKLNDDHPTPYSSPTPLLPIQNTSQPSTSQLAPSKSSTHIPTPYSSPTPLFLIQNTSQPSTSQLAPSKSSTHIPTPYYSPTQSFSSQSTPQPSHDIEIQVGRFMEPPIEREVQRKRLRTKFKSTHVSGNDVIFPRSSECTPSLLSGPFGSVSQHTPSYSHQTSSYLCTALYSDQNNPSLTSTQSNHSHISTQTTPSLTAAQGIRSQSAQQQKCSLSVPFNPSQDNEKLSVGREEFKIKRNLKWKRPRTEFKITKFITPTSKHPPSCGVSQNNELEHYKNENSENNNPSHYTPSLTSAQSTPSQSTAQLTSFISISSDHTTPQDSKKTDGCKSPMIRRNVRWAKPRADFNNRNVRWAKPHAEPKKPRIIPDNPRTEIIARPRSPYYTRSSSPRRNMPTFSTRSIKNFRK